MEHLLYLDPGSGSMLLQALIAGFVGIGIFFRNIKNFVIHILVKSNKEVDGNSPNETGRP